MKWHFLIPRERSKFRRSSLKLLEEGQSSWKAETDGQRIRHPEIGKSLKLNKREDNVPAEPPGG
jgi:hypothetical protein